MPLYGLFCIKVLGGQIKVSFVAGKKKKTQRERDIYRCIDGGKKRVRR